MESKKIRNLKVISQSGRNYKPTPTVILKGQWLNEMGFEIGDQIKVECEQGKLVISLDRERGNPCQICGRAKSSVWIVKGDGFYG